MEKVRNIVLRNAFHGRVKNQVGHFLDQKLFNKNLCTNFRGLPRIIHVLIENLAKFTCLEDSRSDLLPISMMTMLLELCCRASSNQLARWSNVSRLVMSYTNNAPTKK